MTFYFHDLFSFQGVKFIRKFKQLLNPLQVFDLAMGGPSKGWVTAFLCIQCINVSVAECTWCRGVGGCTHADVGRKGGRYLSRLWVEVKGRSHLDLEMRCIPKGTIKVWKVLCSFFFFFSGVVMYDKQILILFYCLTGLSCSKILITFEFLFVEVMGLWAGWWMKLTTRIYQIR